MAVQRIIETARQDLSSRRPSNRQLDSHKGSEHGSPFKKLRRSL